MIHTYSDNIKKHSEYYQTLSKEKKVTECLYTENF